MGNIIDFGSYRKNPEDAGERKNINPEEVLANLFCSMMDRSLGEDIVLKLHLELMPEGNPIWENEPDEQVRKKLLKLARAQESLSRDILVPGNMDLHALHYAIMRLFGWSNGHLHRYTLPAEEFDRLTGGLVGGYMSLCGVVFRADCEQNADLFWDDDYDESKRFSTWLKKKYTGLYGTRAITDTWFEASNVMARVKKTYPSLHAEEKISETKNRWVRYDLCKDLLESLTLSEVFTMSDCRTWDEKTLDAWQSDVAQQIRDCADAKWVMEGGEDYDPEDCFAVCAEDLCRCREQIRALESGIYHDEAGNTRDYHKRVKRETGRSAETLLGMFRGQEQELIMECMPLFEWLRICTMPFTNTVLYNYDFGDDWWLRITVTEIYEGAYTSDAYRNDLLMSDADDDDLFGAEEDDGDLFGAEADDGDLFGAEADDDDLFAADAPGEDSELADFISLFSPMLFRDSSGVYAVTSENAVLWEVIEEGKPKCLAADGINLIDDVGGVSGYIDFMETLKSGSPEEKHQLREWAKMYGWTGRKKKPENML